MVETARQIGIFKSDFDFPGSETEEAAQHGRSGPEGRRRTVIRNQIDRKHDLVDELRVGLHWGDFNHVRGIQRQFRPRGGQNHVFFFFLRKEGGERVLRSVY